MLVAALSAVARGTVERSAQRGTAGLRFGSFEEWRGRHVESADWRGSLACVSDAARVGDALGVVYILC